MLSSSPIIIILSSIFFPLNFIARSFHLSSLDLGNCFEEYIEGLLANETEKADALHRSLRENLSHLFRII